MSRLPAFNESLDLQAHGIGYALFFVGLGWAVAMPFAGWMCRLSGMRRVIVTALASACATVLVIGIVRTQAAFFVSLLAFGMSSGICDAAMNVHGDTVESEIGHPRMPVFHGFWSVGAGLGAIGGTVAESLGVGIGPHAWLAAIACAAIIPFVAKDLRHGPPAHRSQPPHSRPMADLTAISVLLACATIVEGTMADWVPTLFTHEIGASQPTGPALYAIFATSMAAGRFLAVPVQERWGRAWTVRAGAITAATGAAIVLTTVAPAAYAGALLWGLGIGPIFPAAISASGEAGRSSDAIAITAMIGYIASLLGPVAIGLAASAFTIGGVLLIVPFLAGVIVVLAHAVRERSPT
jgi:MFS family permease